VKAAHVVRDGVGRPAAVGAQADRRGPRAAHRDVGDRTPGGEGRGFLLPSGARAVVLHALSSHELLCCAPTRALLALSVGLFA
jgi:hypothetical protein